MKIFPLTQFKMFGVKREKGYLLREILGKIQSYRERRTHPLSGSLWKVTIRYANRAFKENNTFEWKEVYRPAGRRTIGTLSPFYTKNLT